MTSLAQDLHPYAASGTFSSRTAAAGVRVAPHTQCGDIVVDLDRYAVTVGGEQLDLSPRQVELLALFVTDPRRVWSRTQLHALCWGDGPVSRRVDVQLCRLRAKTRRELFRNVRDRGWALATGAVATGAGGTRASAPRSPGSPSPL